MRGQEDEDLTAEVTADMMQQSSTDSSDAAAAPTMCVQGVLYFRRSRSTSLAASLSLWKRRFVFLSLHDGGSITVYKTCAKSRQPSTALVSSMYSSLHRSISMTAGGGARSGARPRLVTDDSAASRDHGGANGIAEDCSHQIDIYVPSSLPWIVKDMEQDKSNFVVEIVGSGEETLLENDDEHPVEIRNPLHALPNQESKSSLFAEGLNGDILEEEDEDVEEADADGGDAGGGNEKRVGSEESFALQSSQLQPPMDESERSASQDDLMRSISLASRRGKPLRIYFCCKKGRHEKSLWLEAFSRLGRLSTAQAQRKKTLVSSLFSASAFAAQSRRRATVSYALARDLRQLELQEDHLSEASPPSSVLNHYSRPANTNVDELVARGRESVGQKDKEYRVQPSYAYPHRWMTRKEMRDEMLLPSETYHNLRHPGCTKKEVGSLKVEVLQCMGLPKLDRTSMTDAIVYLVCGEYAFATDVIPNRANPMWPRKARRACAFPIFHAYARLYVGVFDDDRKRVKDEFAGRVVIDLARLRPHSTYDVTLPLRLSTHVYSKRKRGAIRLRFSLAWKTERDALLSYIPKRVRIPLPQNSRPNLDVVVLCSDQKAFRNIAITVHGANLPGKFTFQQMRAAIREINYTRKYIFTALRTWIRETRHWQFPVTSGLIFLAWMHCIYANQFSLVPAYLVLFFVFQLMRTYAKYVADTDFQQGFIPPSWEELMDALIRGRDEEYRAIEPLELALRPLPLRRRRSPRSAAEASATSFRKSEYVVKTHEAKGKMLFRALGMSRDTGVDAEQLEFPFANGSDYPRFTVKEALVPKRGDGETAKDADADTRSTDGSEDGLSADTFNPRSSTMKHISAAFDHVRDEMPDLLRNMELPDIQSLMRKDSSGLHMFDEEEANFAARHAVVHSGKVAASTITRTGRFAASTVTKTATGLTEIASDLTEKTGLHHVVSPIGHTIHRSSSTLHRGISSGITSGVNFVQGPVSSVSSALFRPQNQTEESDASAIQRSSTLDSADAFSNDIPYEDVALCDSGSEDNAGDSGGDVETAQLLRFPQQNVDVAGPSTGKKITEDLSEIKEKVHEMTWNLFNDKVYHVKHRDAVYFGQSSKKSKKRRKDDVSKNLDKLLKVHQYSHPNPFVARMGLYVEPIIGSAYSFLLPFRAGFNVLTWRDPMLTFWVSVICGVLSLVLFVFPWRIFLFVLGVFLVGPQNYAIRILRERGHLPPLPPRRMFTQKKNELMEDSSALPADQPVFTAAWREPGSDLRDVADSSVDPREIHRVVVPYTPLMYQRFYDWPPEPQYAQVIPDFPVGSPKRSRGNPSPAKVLTRKKTGLVSFAVPFRRVDSASSAAARSAASAGGSSRFLLRRRPPPLLPPAGAGDGPPPPPAAHRPRVASSGNLLQPRALRKRSRSVGDAPRGGDGAPQEPERVPEPPRKDR